MEHSHILFDSDTHFKIDPITRKIINESTTKTNLMQHDHNSERFTFEVKRHVEGHDLLRCNVVEIHYLNVEANTKLTTSGVYTVDDLQVKADDNDTVVCSWSVGRNATQLVGQLQFIIRFACVNEDTGHVEYVWNTSIYNGISIASGIYNRDTDSDNPVPAFNFVTTISGDILKFFVGTQAQYDELSYDLKRNLFAIITDDKSKEEIETEINNLKYTVAHGKVAHAERADEAEHAEHADKATKDAEDNIIDKTYARINSLESGALKPKKATIADTAYRVQNNATTYPINDAYAEIEIETELDKETLYMITVITEGETTNKNAYTFMLYVDAQTKFAQNEKYEYENLYSTYSKDGAHCVYQRSTYSLGRKALRIYSNEAESFTFANAKAVIMRIAKNEYTA